MQDTDYETISRDDVMWEKDGILIFRRDNHWDYDVMACRNYGKEDLVVHCKRDACRLLPTTPLEFFELSDDEIKAMLEN